MKNIIYKPSLNDSSTEQITERIEMYLNEPFSLQRKEDGSVEVIFENNLNIEEFKSLDYAFISLGYIRF
jgi:hypothetical protein